ncbi:MAG: hypothetical protein R3C45_01885 [Phycisphaerales bacterium]
MQRLVGIIKPGEGFYYAFYLVKYLRLFDILAAFHLSLLEFISMPNYYGLTPRTEQLLSERFFLSRKENVEEVIDDLFDLAVGLEHASLWFTRHDLQKASRMVRDVATSLMVRVINSAPGLFTITNVERTGYVEIRHHNKETSVLLPGIWIELTQDDADEADEVAPPHPADYDQGSEDDLGDACHDAWGW